MTSDEEIIESGKYYLYNDVTMEEAGKHFGVSKKTFQLRIGKLLDISPALYKLVQEKKQNNLLLGVVKGGQNSKPNITPRNISPKKIEKANFIADVIISGELTVREAETILKTPKSTIYSCLTIEKLGEEKYLQIQEIFKLHKNKQRIKR